MSHDWFCKCGHEIFGHAVKGQGRGFGRCNFCDCKKYEEKPKPEPKHEHSWGCLDASGKCMITGEV